MRRDRLGHHPRMSRTRLEAFSDAVIAIVMTIMVLELVPPHEASLEQLAELWPIFIAYVLSFAHLGIYSFGLCVVVAAMWLIPDQRIERRAD